VITHRPEHLKAFDYLGPHRYFLTFCTYERHKAFVAGEHVELVRDQILRTSDEMAFDVIAYCFMPDHLHLLTEGLDDRSDCWALIKRAKQFSGYYYSRRVGRKLWQRYGYERTLRTDEATLSVARYIIENPVRAGLVSRPGDHTFSGSSRYTMTELLEAIQMAPAWNRRSG
jgi:putative transposase